MPLVQKIVTAMFKTDGGVAARRSFRWAARDMTAFALLVLCASVTTWYGYCQLSPAVQDGSTFDYWFESDAPAVYHQMIERTGPAHWRTNRHPLFSLLGSAPVWLLRACGVEPVSAVGITLCLTAATLIGIVYLLLRLIHLQVLEAVIFTILTAATAGAVFWFPVPETFSFGAVTMLFALTIVALHERLGRLPLWLYFAASVATLAVTVTNWAAGLLMLVFCLPLRIAGLMAVATFAFVQGIWVIQKVIFPSTWYFLKNSYLEGSFLLNPLALGFGHKAKAFFLTSIISPRVGLLEGALLTIQPSWPSGVLGIGAACLWVALLVTALFGLRYFGRTKVVLVLLGILASQLTLTLFFGQESFLYSLHFAPLLVVFASLGVASARGISLALAACLAVAAGINNIGQFTLSAHYIQETFRKEHDFSARLSKLLPHASLVIQGTLPALLQGAGRSIHHVSPITRMPGELLGIPGQGWAVFSEDWSIELVDALRQKGARYFVTSYRYGLEANQGFERAMARRFIAVEAADRWAIYELSR